MRNIFDNASSTEPAGEIDIDELFNETANYRFDTKKSSASLPISLPGPPACVKYASTSQTCTTMNSSTTINGCDNNANKKVAISSKHKIEERITNYDVELVEHVERRYEQIETSKSVTHASSDPSSDKIPEDMMEEATKIDESTDIDLVLLRQESMDKYIYKEYDQINNHMESDLSTIPLNMHPFSGSAEKMKVMVANRLNFTKIQTYLTNSHNPSNAQTFTSHLTGQDITSISFDHSGVLHAVSNRKGLVRIYDIDEFYYKLQSRSDSALTPVVSINTGKYVSQVHWNCWDTEQLSVSHGYSPDIMIFELGELAIEGEARKLAMQRAMNQAYDGYLVSGVLNLNATMGATWANASTPSTNTNSWNQLSTPKYVCTMPSGRKSGGHACVTTFEYDMSLSSRPCGYESTSIGRKKQKMTRKCIISGTSNGILRMWCVDHQENAAPPNDPNPIAKPTVTPIQTKIVDCDDDLDELFSPVELDLSVKPTNHNLHTNSINDHRTDVNNGRGKIQELYPIWEVNADPRVCIEVTKNRPISIEKPVVNIYPVKLYVCTKTRVTEETIELIGCVNTEGVVSLWDITKSQAIAFHSSAYPVLFKTFSIWSLMHPINNRYDSRTMIPLGELFPNWQSVKVVGLHRCNNKPMAHPSDIYSFSLSNGHVILVDFNLNAIVNSTMDLEYLSEQIAHKAARNRELKRSRQLIEQNRVPITGRNGNISSNITAVTEITGRGILTHESNTSALAYTNGNQGGIGTNELLNLNAHTMDETCVGSCMISLGKDHLSNVLCSASGDIHLNVTSVMPLDRKSFQPLALIDKTKNSVCLGHAHSMKSVFPSFHKPSCTVATSFQFVLPGKHGVFMRDRFGVDDLVAMRIGPNRKEYTVWNGCTSFMIEAGHDLTPYLCCGKDLLKYPDKSNKIRLQQVMEITTLLNFESSFEKNIGLKGSGASRTDYTKQNDISDLKEKKRIESTTYTILFIDAKRIVVSEPIELSAFISNANANQYEIKKYQIITNMQVHGEKLYTSDCGGQSISGGRSTSIEKNMKVPLIMKQIKYETEEDENLNECYDSLEIERNEITTITAHPNLPLLMVGTNVGAIRYVVPDDWMDLSNC